MKIGKWILADTPIHPSQIPFPLTQDQKRHRHNARDGQHVTWRVYLIKISKSDVSGSFVCCFHDNIA